LQLVGVRGEMPVFQIGLVDEQAIRET
jgi:hypothetical protein